MRYVLKAFVINLIITYNLTAQVTGLEGWNIFVDPGHSRKENMGIYGYSESERNLGVGLWLREMLLNTTDIDTVYMSRTNNQEYVTLSQRTDYANSVGAAWYHSIHSNAGPPQLNSTLLLWGQYYNGQEKVPHGGKAMSDIMVGILTRGMRTTTMGSIGDCSFYTSSDWCQRSGGPYLHVNRVTSMPSELSEAGFHTNPRQNQLFMNSEWKKLEAKTFYWSVLKFHGIERPFVGTCVGIVTDQETGTPINGAIVTMNGQSYTTDTFESLFHKYTDDADLLHNGFFYIENLAGDTLQMIVQAEGYYSDTSRVAIVDTFFTFQDVTLLSKVPPNVVSTTPAQSDTNFPAWDDIIIDFSRTMNRASVESTLVFDPSVTGRIRWSYNDRKMTFRPDSLDFETEYTLSISGNAQDVYGHPLDGNGDGIGGDDFLLHFKTGPSDMTAPQLVSMYPRQNTLSVELQPIVSASYDEELDPASVTEDVFKLERTRDYSSAPGVLKHYVVNDRSVLNFFPTEKLFANEVYRTRIFAGLRDLVGNTVSAGKAFSFQTTDRDLDYMIIDDFETNASVNWLAPQQSDSTVGIISDSTSRDENNEIVNLLTESSKSLKVKYGWDESANSWLIQVRLADSSQAKNVNFNNSYILQVYVFGDGSGNKFRFCVDDHGPDYTATNKEVSTWYTINWIGWKLVSWELSGNNTGSWIGDGVLDGTLRFDSIQLTHEPGDSTFGAIYLDDLRLAQTQPTKISAPKVSVPSEVAIYQNYPNPFNPKTTITYDLPRAGWVTLRIFDVTGKEISTLVNAKQSVGQHKAVWDGSAYPSGIYVCELQVAGQRVYRKMILSK